MGLTGLAREVEFRFDGIECAADADSTTVGLQEHPVVTQTAPYSP